MSLLDLNLQDVKDLRSVEPGEYKVRLIEVKQAVSKNLNDYIMARFSLPDVPDAKDFNHIMMLPDNLAGGSSGDEKKSTARLRAIKSFMTALGQDVSGEIDLDKMAGAEGWALLIEEEDEQYGTQNRIKRFM
jgi:hypothetical protein